MTFSDYLLPAILAFSSVHLFNRLCALITVLYGLEFTFPSMLCWNSTGTPLQGVMLCQYLLPDKASTGVVNYHLDSVTEL